MDGKYIKLFIISFLFVALILVGENNVQNVYAVELPVIPIGEEGSESNDNSNKQDTQLPIIEENEESNRQKDTTTNKKEPSKKQEEGQTEIKTDSNEKTDLDKKIDSDKKKDNSTGGELDKKRTETEQKDTNSSDKKSDHVTSGKKTDHTDKKSASSDTIEDTDSILPVMAPDGSKVMEDDMIRKGNTEKSAGQETKKEVSETDTGNKQLQSDCLDKDYEQTENMETEDKAVVSSINLAVWIIAGLVVLVLAGVVFKRKKDKKYRLSEKKDGYWISRTEDRD